MNLENNDLILIIDMQNVYLPNQPWGCFSFNRSLQNIKRLINSCEKKSRLNRIFFTNFIHNPKATGIWAEYNVQNKEINNNAWMSEIVDDLKYCASKYPVLTKSTSTGFIANLNASLTAQLPTGYRFDLPTEAQWEYACRAGTTTSLNNGTNIVNASSDSNLNAVGWYSQNCSKTHTVGVKTPNAWGLYDMHGNVFEWCKDWYGNYLTTAVTDPAGPDTGSGRVIRGGSWYYYPYNCRSAYRSDDGPSDRGSFCGFRLALVLVQ